MSTGIVPRPTKVFDKLIELNDVEEKVRTHNDVLVYNQTLNLYEHKPGNGAGMTLGYLNNVAPVVDTLGAGQDGHVLTWDNALGKWINEPIPAPPTGDDTVGNRFDKYTYSTALAVPITGTCVFLDALNVPATQAVDGGKLRIHKNNFYGIASAWLSTLVFKGAALDVRAISPTPPTDVFFNKTVGAGPVNGGTYWEFPTPPSNFTSGVFTTGEGVIVSASFGMFLRNNVDASIGVELNGQSLIYRTAQNAWVNETLALSLGQLSNVDNATDLAATNQLLIKTAGEWANVTANTWQPLVDERLFFQAETGVRTLINSSAPTAGQIGYGPLATPSILLANITNIYVPNLDINGTSYQFANDNSTAINDTICLFAKDATVRTYRSYYRITAKVNALGVTNYTVISLPPVFGAAISGGPCSLTWYPDSRVPSLIPARVSSWGSFGGTNQTSPTPTPTPGVWVTVSTGVGVEVSLVNFVVGPNPWELKYTGPTGKRFLISMMVQCYSPTQVDRVFRHAIFNNGSIASSEIVNYTVVNNSSPESSSHLNGQIVLTTNDILSIRTRLFETTLPQPTNVVINQARAMFIEILT